MHQCKNIKIKLITIINIDEYRNEVNTQMPSKLSIVLSIICYKNMKLLDYAFTGVYVVIKSNMVKNLHFSYFHFCTETYIVSTH